VHTGIWCKLADVNGHNASAFCKLADVNGHNASAFPAACILESPVLQRNTRVKLTPLRYTCTWGCTSGRHLIENSIDCVARHGVCNPARAPQQVLCCVLLVKSLHAYLRVRIHTFWLVYKHSGLYLACGPVQRFLKKVAYVMLVWSSLRLEASFDARASHSLTTRCMA
jgi:hypothetical protein